ncbi:cysteine-rich CWC family protein [Simiduia agarivorans]|uniref:Cysteine-rich CWC family protein n=1 Tax=Simiduia agarivorans (strain DSM 21679 / JCM 13881 / BCRC 17597 / SA1) TaxID=1117647 RepID=K4KJ75_SIMAS|nr:cysteine-rich CWC family protein [Simiduia agarivorans]AFU99096.1 hypothetical protein M5M_09555 [Simiduia agarivorans SA1 = DSM 21679]
MIKPHQQPASNSLCPLCQRDNHCALARGHAPDSCWCMHTAVDATQQSRAQAIDPARCVCPYCAAPTKGAKR